MPRDRLDPTRAREGGVGRGGGALVQLNDALLHNKLFHSKELTGILGIIFGIWLKSTLLSAIMA